MYPNEGGNAFRNFVGRDIVRKGARPTLESLIQQQRLLENEAVGRWKEIYKEGMEYKTKMPRVFVLTESFVGIAV